MQPETLNYTVTVLLQRARQVKSYKAGQIGNFSTWEVLQNNRQMRTSWLIMTTEFIFTFLLGKLHLGLALQVHSILLYLLNQELPKPPKPTAV